MKRAYAIGGSIAVVILIIGGMWWYRETRVPIALPIAPEDNIASWNFKGAYTGNPELTAKAGAEIAWLKSLRGEGTYTDYELYVSIAGAYQLLGEGGKEYEYLNRAIAKDVGNSTGLAWNNMGALFERLGALHTAREAYSRAAAIQSQVLQYHLAYLSFLVDYFPEDKTAIDAALAAAQKEFGNLPDFENIRAQSPS